MLRMGIRATVNSDDPAYFSAYLTDNLITVQQEAGLDAGEVLQLQRNAVQIAWVPANVRDELLAGIDEYAATAMTPA